MMEETHIADGIAVKLLLAGIVIASGVVGAIGLAPVASQAAADGLADAPAPVLMFPINNVTAGVGSLLLSLDGKGNDPFLLAASIDDVTVTGGSWDVTGTDRIGATGIGSTVSAAVALPQDMDPY